MPAVGGDAARHVQVFDCGKAESSERSGRCVGIVALHSNVNGKRVALSVECALEGFIRSAHNRAHTDVGVQLHGLSAVGGAVADIISKRVPIFCRIDVHVCPRPLAHHREQQDENRKRNFSHIT